MTKTLDELQAEIGAWGDATFPGSTIDSVMSHLAEEVVELFDAWRMGADEQETEAADVLILLLHYAHKNGFSLAERAEQKMIVNRDRWAADAPAPSAGATRRPPRCKHPACAKSIPAHARQEEA